MPSLWKLEVANILELSVRRGRATSAFHDRSLALLEGLGIEIDIQTDLWAWTTTRALTVRYRLTVYDAAYLALATRLGLPIATLDRELKRAADAEACPS